MIQAGIIADVMLHGITLDRDSRLSLRRQLAGHLESRILAGQIGPGHRLPSVRRAEELLGLHRNTVAAAYRDLVRAGLVRIRPGSGAYVRLPGREGRPAMATVIVRGLRSVELVCPDPDLEPILAAELRVRFGLRVRVSAEDAGGGTALLLSPSREFLQMIRSLPRPSIVAVISSSELFHRLASIAVLIHGGEGLGYVPASRVKRRELQRILGLSRKIAADYASLSLARRWLSPDVLPLPVISEYSFTLLTTHPGRRERDSRGQPAATGTAERSLQARVQEP